MNILFLKGFNNYFNRIVKKYSTLADYKANSAAFLEFTSINFNPNDGISTELVVGNPNQQVWTFNGGTQAIGTPLNWENDGAPDYAICYENEGTPSVSVIKHRWFIMEAQRTRKGQYRLAFKRDIIVDHFNEIMTAPCFVEKGIINDNTDPLLFNNEQMSFNQIKQSEVLLKDKTGCGWLVGYVAQDTNRYPASDYYESSSPVATYEAYSSVPAEIIRLASVGTFQRPVARINSGWGQNAGGCYMLVNWRSAVNPAKYQLITLKNNSGVVGHNSPTTTAPNGYLYVGWGVNFEVDDNTHMGTGGEALMQAIRYDSTLRDYYIDNILTNGEDFDDNTQELIEAWNGRYFKKDGKIYQIKYERIGNPATGPYWEIKEGTTYYTALSNVLSSIQTSHENDGLFKKNGTEQIGMWSVNISGPSSGATFCRLAWEYYTAKVSFVEVPADTGDKIKTYIPGTRVKACDTPMDLFAIPYSDEFKVYTEVDAETGDPVESTAFTMSKQAALQAAISLAQAGDNIYDIQLLPYFPNPAMIETEDTAGIGENIVILPNTDFTEDTHYNFYYNNSGTKIGIMFWSRTSTFTTDIGEELTLANTNPLTLKTSNSCDLFRLTSPNYAGSFEFSLAKSGGRINRFNADCTYKPYSPYIHITPYLAGLYGENFNTIDDARGLICGGDFSITKIVNQWQQYELQNKNYQAIFDRQIQNLDVNNKIAMEQQDWKNMQSVFGGILGGSAGGAIGGLKSAGPYGAIAGAVLGTAYGTAMSEIGAIKQTDWLQRSQAETKDYTIDMYNYNLGNIKALPNALSKTSALTNNNKIFPFVEYFTCTDAEKEVFVNKLKYNGMTVMKIDSLAAYANSTDFDKVYVKGQLIRLEDIVDDFHVADAIYQEVNKGFFVIQGE